MPSFIPYKNRSTLVPYSWNLNSYFRIFFCMFNVFHCKIDIFRLNVLRDYFDPFLPTDCKTYH